MFEPSNSKFSAGKLRQKIAIMFGASPTQYRYLLETEKIVEKRALEQKGDSPNLQLIVTCLLCFSISAFFTSMPFFLPMDTFTYALIGITMSMMMIGLWTIPYFDILLSPINYPVIAHTPVSSRTYFLVKLTQVATYTIWILASLNLMPAIGGIWIRGEESSPFQFLFPLVYLPIVFMSGLFTTGVMTVFAGYLTKLYTRQALRSIAQYAQFIFPVLFPAVLVTLPHLLPSLPKDKLTSALKWFYALPNGWFAGMVSLVLGQIERHFLILAGLAVVSTLFLVLVPLRSIAKSYSEYLSYLLESGSRQKSKLRVKTSLFARMFRNRTIRAGFCLSRAYMCRDKHILRQFFASFGTVIMLIVLFARDSSFYMTWPHDTNAIGLSPGFSGMFYFVGISAITGFISPVKCSEHYKASWMLTLTPVPVPKDLWRGVQATTILCIVAPCTLLMLCIATIFWGILGIFYILPVLTILLYFVILYPKPESGLPLAEEFVHRQVAGDGCLPMIASIHIIGFFVGIQLLTFWLNVWVYYGFYCVTVIGGLIGFVYFLRKNKRVEATLDA